MKASGPTAWSTAQTSQALRFSDINRPGGLQTAGFLGRKNPQQSKTQQYWGLNELWWG